MVLRTDDAVGLFHRQHLVVEHVHAVGGEDGDLPVVHVHHVPGVLDDGRHVRGDEVAVLTVPDDEGTVLPGGDQGVGIVGADDAQGIGALDAGEHLRDRGQNVLILTLIVVFQQLGHHLRIGIGYKCDPLAKQVLLDFQVIFNNAVMNQCNLAVFTDMGMRIDIVRLSMGRPAGVSDSKGPL